MTLNYLAPDRPTVIAAAADGDGKRIARGLIVPFGIPGRTSAGLVSVSAGSVAIPEDVGRVKLYRDHSTEGGTPVGYATELVVTERGIEGAFQIADTADGHLAVADIQQRVRDALSIEFGTADIEGETVTAASLTAVALVPVPAFDDARVTSITAQQKAPTMTKTTAPDPTTPDPSVPDPSGPKTPATAPAGIGTTALLGKKTGTAVTASRVTNLIADMRAGKVDLAAPSADLTAALADITISSQPHVSAPQWLGELFSASPYQRRVVPLFENHALVNLEARGYRWTKRPTIADYAGDKAEIPTGPVTQEPVSMRAKRLAGGNDIDRAFFDFPDSGFLEAYFRLAVEEYAIVSDSKAEAFITDPENAKLLPAQPDAFRAVAKARQVLTTTRMGEPSFVLVNPDDLFDLLNFTQMDTPGYLKILGVDPTNWIPVASVPAGTIIAGVRRALNWFEMPGSPIRVNAEHIAHGGKDVALFGYYATLLTNADGVVRVPFGTPAGE